MHGGIKVSHLTQVCSQLAVFLPQVAKRQERACEAHEVILRHERSLRTNPLERRVGLLSDLSVLSWQHSGV